MALQVDDPLAIGQDWFDANAISILYLERIDRISISLRTLLAGKIQRDRLALAVGIDALDDDVAERSCNGKATSVIQERGQRCFAGFHLVNRGPLDRTVDRYLRTGRRDQQRVSAFKMPTSMANAVQQEVVKINLLYQLLPTKVAQRAQRTGRCRTAGGVQRAQRSCQRTDVVTAGTLHVADYIDTHRSQVRDRDHDLCIAILLFERASDQALCPLQGETRNLHGTRFGQQDTAVAVYYAGDADGHAAPHVDSERVPRTDHIVRSDSDVQRSVAGRYAARGNQIAIQEDLRAKALEMRRLVGDLRIKIAHRSQIVGCGQAKHLGQIGR